MKYKDNYKSFYENIDRDKLYSSQNDLEKHPMTGTLRKWLDQNDLNDKKILEIGSGNGRFQDIVADYIGIDVSESAKKFYHKPYFVTDDKKKYPIEDETIDGIFTKTAFEHIPDIIHALRELHRVLKTEGVVFFRPAWNCRPWAADGYQQRPYSDFKFSGKIYKASITFRNNIIYRSLLAFPKRFYYMILFLINKNSFKTNLIYTKIKANYETYWQSDSDACNSLDPFLTILYFRANKYIILNYPTLISQFFIRQGPVIIKKK